MLKYRFILFIVMCCFSGASYTQTVNSLLEKKVIISPDNITVIEILHEIEKNTGITFSFKSDLFNKDKPVTLESKEKSIHDILDILFIKESILYKEMGNQILLYSEKPLNIIQEPELKDTDKVVVKIINDTVFRYINTTNVKVYDTIRYVFFDTIRPKIEKQPSNLTFEFGLSPSIFSPKYTSNNTFYADLIDNAEKPKLSFNLYAKINKNIKQLKLSTGLMYSIDQEQADYNVYENYTHIIYDTVQTWNSVLDTSYRISYNTGGGGKPDSIVWTYVYEKIPIDSIVLQEKTDSIQLSASKKNKYHYLQFPITIGWEKQFTDKLIFSINTGPVINILISKNGHILNPDLNYKIVDFNEVPFIKINFAWILNTGVYYKFKPYLAGSFQVSYFQQLQSSFSSDFPISKFSRNLMFSFGCAFYLKSFNSSGL